MFVRFAMAYGVLSPRQAVGLWRRAWAALSTLAAAQGGHHVAADPVDRYVELLCSAISSGLAHVASVADGPPKDALALGWRPYHHGSEIDLRPQGERVGWVNGDDLFLDPTSAYRAVQAAARGGAPVALAEHTMRLRLRERGLLVASEDQRLTVRKQIGHVRRHVLHLQTKTIRGPVHPVHPIHGPGGSNGSVRQEQSDTKEGM